MVLVKNMESTLNINDIVVVKKEYQKKVSILPGTRMFIAELKEYGNIRTIWVDESIVPYSAIFYGDMLRKIGKINGA
jgi:hypothetical protein